MASIKYTPFGATMAATGVLDTDIKFTGQRLDTAIDLYYYGARYYDANNGRFISADTVSPRYGNPQTLNRYSYALNNPLRYIDPTGNIEAERDYVEEVKTQGAGYAQDMLDFLDKVAAAGLTLTDNDTAIRDAANATLGRGSEDGGEGGQNESPAVFVLRGIQLLGPIIVVGAAAALTATKDAVSDLLDATREGIKDVITKTKDLLARSKGIEDTPTTHPEKYKPVRGTNAKQNTDTGEIWERDKSRHGGDHYEVYKNKKMFEKNIRDRDVWSDGRPKSNK